MRILYHFDGSTDLERNPYRRIQGSQVTIPAPLPLPCERESVEVVPLDLDLSIN
jgi:hypothetical protein